MATVASPAPEDEPQRDPVVNASRFVSERVRQAAASAAETVQQTGRAIGARLAAAFFAFWAVVATAWFWKRVLVWLIRLFCLPVLGMTYTVISAEGLRNLFGVLAVPLYKAVPVLHAMGRYRETRRIDVAVILSLVLMAGSWIAWGKVIALYVRPLAKLTNEEKLLWVVGGGLLVCDAALFALGILSGGGFMVGLGTSVFGALVLTTLYLCLLILVAYVIHSLER